jgi:hypothetical protein
MVKNACSHTPPRLPTLPWHGRSNFTLPFHFHWETWLSCTLRLIWNSECMRSSYAPFCKLDILCFSTLKLFWSKPGPNWNLTLPEMVTVTKSTEWKLEQFHCRPGQVLSVPGVWGSQFSRNLAHEGGEGVSPTHQPSLPPGNIPGTNFF